MYWANWCDALKTNISISAVPLNWHNFIKIVEFSFHSLESLVCLDSLAASIFTDPGKYLAVIVIFRFKRYCEISLLIAVNSCFLIPPFSLCMTGLSCCPCRCELILHPFPLMWRILQLVRLPLAPRHLCEIFVLPLAMAPLLSGCDNSLPSLVMMHPSLLLFVVGEKLKTSRYRELNFLSTITVLSLPPPKFPLSLRKCCDKLISESFYVMLFVFCFCFSAGIKA